MGNDARLSARLLDSVARQMHSTKTLVDLSAGQWAILRYLKQFGVHGRTLGDVATYFNEDRVIVSRAMASLQREALVAPTADGDMQSLFKLTDAGEKKLQLDPVEVIAKATSSLPDEQREALNQLLEALLTALIKAENESAP